ncbi:MAG TPA: FAD-dependent oxidoreductase, partial [Gemmataceae bacterium]|nr:FAD-dependent oxidoreductase [Gemmataceae bacterium]
MDGLARTVPLEAPWKAARAKDWDVTTVDAWLRKNASRPTRDEFQLELETELGKAGRISLLYYLFYIHSAGGVHALDVDAQKMRFRAGPQAISKKLADALGKNVVLASPARRIRQELKTGVEVESSRLRVRAQRIIVAMMPADMRRIEFVPSLPADRLGLNRSWHGETAFKVNVVYREAFWRTANLSGLGVGELGVTFDNSPPSGSPGVLVLFADKEHLPGDRSKRRAVLLDDLVKLFGKQAR